MGEKFVLQVYLGYKIESVMRVLRAHRIPHERRFVSWGHMGKGSFAGKDDYVVCEAPSDMPLTAIKHLMQQVEFPLLRRHSSASIDPVTVLRTRQADVDILAYDPSFRTCRRFRPTPSGMSRVNYFRNATSVPAAECPKERKIKFR